MEIKIGVLTYPPFVNQCWRTCDNAGFTMDILHLLCATHNLSCTYVDSPVNETMNSSWSMLLEHVRDGIIDTTVPVITATSERSHMIDFGPTIFFMELVLVFRTPQLPQLSFSRLMALQWNVWLCLIICMFVIGVILTLAEWGKNGKKCLSRTFWNCFNMYALLTNQSQEMSLFRAGTQILVGFWALSVLVVSGIYSGNLLTFLLHGHPDYPFSDFATFVDCLERRECRLVLTSTSSSLTTMLNNSETEYFARLMKVLSVYSPIVNPSPESIVENMLNIEDKYLVWFTSEAAFGSVTDNNLDCLYTAVYTGFTDRHHFPLHKHSMFKKIIEKFSQHLRSTGLHMKLYNYYVKPNVLCAHETGRKPDRKPMPVSSMFSLLFILAIGYVLSSCTFMFEKLFRVRRNSLTFDNI